MTWAAGRKKWFSIAHLHLDFEEVLNNPFSWFGVLPDTPFLFSWLHLIMSWGGEVRAMQCHYGEATTVSYWKWPSLPDHLSPCTHMIQKAEAGAVLSGCSTATIAKLKP